MPTSTRERTRRPDRDARAATPPERRVRAWGPVSAGSWAMAYVRTLWAASHPDGEPFPGERGEDDTAA